MDPEEAIANAIPRRENFCLLSCPDGATLVVVLWYRTIVDAPNLRFRDRIRNLIISGANNSILFLCCLVQVLLYGKTAAEQCSVCLLIHIVVVWWNSVVCLFGFR